MSKIGVIISGVIQGSCLGPVLLLLYANDLTDDVIVKMYADDVKLYCNCKLRINYINPQLQSHLDRLCRWAHEWLLQISYTKYNVLEIGKPSRAEYKMNSQSIVPVKNVVDLGVTIDNKLKISDHIKRIVRRPLHRSTTT